MLHKPIDDLIEPFKKEMPPILPIFIEAKKQINLNKTYTQTSVSINKLKLNYNTTYQHNWVAPTKEQCIDMFNSPFWGKFNNNKMELEYDKLEYKNRLVSLTTKYTLDEFKDNNKRYFQDINDNNNTSNIQSNIQLKTTNESVNPAKKVKLMYKQIQK